MGMVMIDGRVVSSGQWVWIAAAARQSRLFENFGTEKNTRWNFRDVLAWRPHSESSSEMGQEFTGISLVQLDLCVFCWSRESFHTLLGVMYGPYLSNNNKYKKI